MLILHYLGLDHIGHISGPHSSLIQPKLLEMDDILKKIHSALISKVILYTIFNYQKIKILLWTMNYMASLALIS